MGTLRLLCAAALLPVLMEAQAHERPLSYHGWALWISFDSAAILADAQIGRTLECVGMDTKTMFCQAYNGTRHASLYFSPVPRRLEELAIMTPLDCRASSDSLKNWFTTQWGPTLPRDLITAQSAPTRQSRMHSEVIGSWARNEIVLGMVGIVSYDTTRMLSVSISSPAREIRLLRERADSGHKR